MKVLFEHFFKLNGLVFSKESVVYENRGQPTPDGLMDQNRRDG